MLPVDGTVSVSTSFLGLGCTLPGIHMEQEGDHVSRSWATKKGRAESSKDRESISLANS